VTATPKQGLARFLQLARCPDCFQRLAADSRGIACRSGHEFPINAHGIPAFATTGPPYQPAQIETAEEDAAAYAAMRGYAAEALGRGESEGLYATVASLVHSGLAGTSPLTILDAGCGTGRTTVDLATAFPGAFTVGLDSDPHALLIAHAIARLRGRAVHVDLRRWGFGERTIAARNLKNVFFAQGKAERMPFGVTDRWKGFDVVTCVNLLDRVPDPAPLLSELARVLAPGGRIVLTTPMNWRQDDGAFWAGGSTVAALARIVESVDLVVDLAFDGLVYREIIDARGSATDWLVAVISGQKGRSGQDPRPTR
jgi:SAM-dependent methyltransferase